MNTTSYHPEAPCWVLNLYDGMELHLSPQHQTEIMQHMIKLGYISTCDPHIPGSRKPQRSKPSDLFLITINPRPGSITIESFHKYVKARLKKVWMQTYWYCFELTKNGAPHVHIMVRTKKQMRSSDVKKGFLIPDSNIHVRIQDDEGKGLKYLQGYKKGEYKPMHSQDIEFRSKNKLLDIYTNSENAQGPNNQ